MDTDIIQHKKDLHNAMIYVDYENIYELLKKYGVNPIDINFFPVILDKFRNTYRFNVIECILYGNFEKKPFQGRHQTILHNLGLQTRHTASCGKNCGDLMLTVDTLTTLYKNPNINVFIIVSSDRDMIPLLKTIKYENKFAYVLSTKYGFNPVVSCYADYHEYIEDIFDLKPEMIINEAVDLEIPIKEELKESDIENAKEVSRLLYSSNVWRIYETEGNPITLKGYLSIVAKKIGRDAAQVIKDFELAHHFKYITIYQDQDKGLCIKKGDNYAEVMIYQLKPVSGLRIDLKSVNELRVLSLEGSYL